MSTRTRQQAFQIALTHLQNGQLAQAEALYRQILAVEPQNPDALHLLGVIAHQVGQPSAAAELIAQAITLKGDDDAFYFNLGEALFACGRLDESIASFSQAIALRPDHPGTYNSLGTALCKQDKFGEAAAYYERALALQSDNPEVCNNLGVALHAQDKFEEAIACYKQALTLRPHYPEAYNNMGIAFKAQERPEEAILSYEQAIILKPDFAEAHHNMGKILMSLQRLPEATAHYRRALELKPDDAEAVFNLGAALSDQGKLKEALACYRRMAAMKPDDPIYHGVQLYTLHLVPGYDARALLDEHREWETRHGAPRRRFQRPHTNDPDPKRRLKIGYVSPDLHGHPVGRFLLPLFQNHSHDNFEITCYADVAKSDAVTDRLRECADRWHDAVSMTEEQLAEQIRSDGIDILVDLSLHTGGNHLTMFARKPAPIQVTYLAYPSTSGLDAIDYRLTDPYLDPPGATDDCYTEISIRLPETYWCFQPSNEAPSEVTALPALTAGYIIFGCLNNFWKINRQMLVLWARILRATPHSRLLLYVTESSHRDQLRESLAQEGIDPTRLNFADRMPLAGYFANHSRTDIALDTLPYAGGTTTCEALWMGVPVVSLVGKTGVGRGGLSILSNIGLPELAAQDEDEYIKTAVELAHDLPRLVELRATMRERMLASPLMDAPRFAQNIERAYRAMWQAWCKERLR